MPVLWFAAVLGLGLGIAVAVKIYAKWSCGRYKITQNLSEKTILITGASSGIGKISALELARAGATIHMLCRNLEKANHAAEEIRKIAKNDRIFVWEMDTSKLGSVRNFAKKFLGTETPIDVLINNAGVMWVLEQEYTEDGLELTMATNHYGHFLLTNLLLDRIKRNKGARIINVSSIAHLTANFDLSNYNLTEGYSSHRAYANSKLANILFTRHLSEMLSDSGITVNCLHPGAVLTELFRYTQGVKKFFCSLIFPWFKSAEEGAQCTLYLAAAPELQNVTGKYFWDCKIATISSQAKNQKLAKEFWDLSCKLTGLTKN